MPHGLWGPLRSGTSPDGGRESSNGPGTSRCEERRGAVTRHNGGVKVHLRNPTRTFDVDGPVSIVALLQRLDLNRESVLVIRSGTLVPGDAVLEDSDEVEIRPVISGGAR